MRKMSIVFAVFLAVAAACPLYVMADSYDKYRSQYPDSLYLVGIGEVPGTDNRMADRRVAEVLARREIAVQIKVKVSETTLDVICSEQTPTCKDMVRSEIETSVNEFLQGSRIVDTGLNDGVFFAVAVMLREGVSEDLARRHEQAMNNAKEALEKARAGDKDSAARAREEFLKAKAYEVEREIIGGVKADASGAMGDLDAEIKKLGQ